MQPRLRKTFPRFPFVYFGNLGKTQIRGQKFFLRRVIEKKQNKIPLISQKYFSVRRALKILKIPWFGEKSNKNFFMGLSPKHLYFFTKKNPKKWKIVFNSIYWEYLLFANLQKNLEKWKKHSVLIVFPCHDLNQNSSTSDLSFSQVTSVEKREPRKHFSASACSFLGLGLRPRPQKSGFGF